MDTKRDLILENGQVITLPSVKDKNNYVDYKIKKFQKYTDTTVTYLVERELGGKRETGYLVEFYPQEESGLFSFERNEDNVLTELHSAKVFKEHITEYQVTVKNRLLSYEKGKLKARNNIRNVLQSVEWIDINGSETSKQEEIFFSRIQKLFGKKGSTMSAVPTLYMWMALPWKTDAKSYINLLYENTELDAYTKLTYLIKLFDGIADAIQELHSYALHFAGGNLSDIYLNYTDDFMVESKSVTISDLYILVGKNEEILDQTECYKPKEFSFKVINEKTDYFAWGMLFLYALSEVIEITEGIKTNEDEEWVAYVVNQAKFVEESEGYSKPYFKYCLLRVLKKCVQNLEIDRYDSFSAFNKDWCEVKRQLNSVEPEEGVPLLKKGNITHDIAIQRMLYERPLYKGCSEEDKTMHVLVIGGGAYSQMFLDQALQSAQMPFWTVSIDVLSMQSEMDRKTYMGFRPALTEFVRVNGEYDRECSDQYATLTFSPLDEENRRFVKGDQEWNELLAQSIVRQKAQENYQYIFIALGDDILNASVAEAFNRVTNKIPINYAVDYKKNLPKDICIDDTVYAVCMKENELPGIMSQSLETMAFNTHLSWKNTLNKDESKLRKEFVQDTYAYSSSTAYALSIKYKLYSVGIDMESSKTIEAAAGEFYSRILEKRDSDETVKTIYNEMIAAEHRRWVLEKVLGGWKPLKKDGRIDYDRCMEVKSAKDGKNRRHACIVHGNATLKLQENEYTEQSMKGWNQANELDQELDELDRMSVELHRKYMKEAETLMKNPPFDEGYFMILSNLIPEDNDAMQRAWKKYVFYHKNLFNGASNYVDQYDYYEKELLKALDKLSAERYEDVKKAVAGIRTMFFPVVEALSYRDYKKNDAVLIDKIPFIMTYRRIGTLAMAFASCREGFGRNDSLFANVAAATVLSPEKIFYVYYYTENDSEQNFIKSFKGVLNYLEKRGMKCQVHMQIAYENKIHKNKIADFEGKLKNLKKIYTGIAKSEKKEQTRVKFADFKLLACENTHEVIGKLIYPMTRRKNLVYNFSSRLFRDDKNSEELKFNSMIQECAIPHFQYSASGDEKFVPIFGCEYLKYVDNTTYLRVEDIFNLTGAVATGYTLPEFNEDYNELWQIYCGCYFTNSREREQIRIGGETWWRLCTILEDEKIDEQGELFSIERSSLKEGDFKKVYYVPMYTYKTYQCLIHALSDYGIFKRNECYIRRYSSDSCQMQIVSKYDLTKKMNQMIEYQHYYIDENSIIVNEIKNKEEYVFVYNTLYAVVNKGHFLLNNNVENLLKELERRGYIQIYKNKPEGCRYADKVSDAVIFAFASDRIKNILTKAGLLFEIYTYYEVLKTGYFDDVITSYEFLWSGKKGDSVKNELDLVLTKGFRTIIVECKSVDKLKADYYTKLDSLVNMFGINARRVMAANLYKGNTEEDANKIQTERGKGMEVITLSSYEDIKNIGERLVAIMKS